MSRPAKPATCHPDRKSRVRGLCQPCFIRKYYQENKQRLKDYAKEYYKENREHQLYNSRNGELKKKYGLSYDDYLKMVEEQLGKCYICKRQEDYKLHVDHNHKTGKVRKLLCNRCNYLLSAVENTDHLAKFLGYLEEHNDIERNQR